MLGTELNLEKTTEDEPVVGTFSSPSPSSWSTSILSTAPVELHDKAIGYMVTSLTEKSRTLKAGLSIAHCSAQPLAIASSALRVVEHLSSPNHLAMRSFTAGMRLVPPMISTDEISSFISPLALKACSMMPSSLTSSGSATESISERSIMPFTSMSFMKFSMLMGA